MDLTKNNGASQETLQPKEWQRLSEWIHCICVVTFDLELGQAMEVMNNSLDVSQADNLAEPLNH